MLIVNCATIKESPIVYEVYINNSKIGNTPAAYSLDSNTTYEVNFKRNGQSIFSKKINIERSQPVKFDFRSGKACYINLISNDIVYF